MKSKEYIVKIPMVWYLEYRVKAKSEEEAKKKAWNKYDKWYKPSEYVTNCFDIICEGSIFYWEINETIVILNE